MRGCVVSKNLYRNYIWIFYDVTVSTDAIFIVIIQYAKLPKQNECLVFVVFIANKWLFPPRILCLKCCSFNWKDQWIRDVIKNTSPNHMKNKKPSETFLLVMAWRTRIRLSISLTILGIDLLEHFYHQPFQTFYIDLYHPKASKACYTITLLSSFAWPSPIKVPANSRAREREQVAEKSHTSNLYVYMYNPNKYTTGRSHR